MNRRLDQWVYGNQIDSNKNRIAQAWEERDEKLENKEGGAANSGSRGRPPVTPTTKTELFENDENKGLDKK
jgi:hypothetical protein